MTNKCTIISKIITPLHVVFFVSLTLFVTSSLFIHCPSISIPSCLIYLILTLLSLQQFYPSSPLFYLSSTPALCALSTPPLLPYIFPHFLLVLLLLLSLRLSILTLSSLLSFIFSYSPPAVHRPWNYKLRWLLGLTSTLRLGMHCSDFLKTRRQNRPRNGARSCR
jgi:hypothetical protein